MKHKRWVVIAVSVGGLLVGIWFFTPTTPNYGVNKKWKKLLLNNLLSDDVPKISVSDASAKKGHTLFLDAREEKEYRVSHIEGALFTGYENFDLGALDHVPKNESIITYCSIGKRSDAIAKKLMEAGYTDVQNLYGGIFEWVNNGYPVVDHQNKPTRQVHAFNSLWAKWLEKGEKIY